jgi:hypothetical protein
MTANAILQCGFFLVVLLALAKPLGSARSSASPTACAASIRSRG